MPRKAKSQESETQETEKKKRTYTRRKKDEMTSSPDLSPEELREEIHEIQNPNYDELEDEIEDGFLANEDGDSDPRSDSSVSSKWRARESVQHPKPKYTYPLLAAKNLTDLKKLAKEMGISLPASIRKDDLIITILKAQAESMNYRFGGGTLEILPENFGFLRPKGMLPTDRDRKSVV